MKLNELTTRYIDFKRNTGMRFGSEAWVLRAFCRAMGDIDINAVRPEAVVVYIAGDGPVTSFWHHKFKILDGFYRYAIARGYTQALPLCPSVRRLTLLTSTPPMNSVACSPRRSTSIRPQVLYKRSRFAPCCCCSIAPGCASVKP